MSCLLIPIEPKVIIIFIILTTLSIFLIPVISLRFNRIHPAAFFDHHLKTIHILYL